MTTGWAEELYVLTERLVEPGGLGEVARHALRIGKPIELEDCDEIRGASILNVDYPRRLPATNRNYAWTVFESDRIPQSWVDALNECYRAAFVPHESVRRAFVDSGVERPVHVIPQGFKRLERTQPMPERNGPLHVGIMGILVPRKNVAPLVRAVHELNVEGYDIQLWVQFTCWMIPEMQHLIEAAEADPCVHADFRRELPDTELARWLSGLHAYIMPSSGEGWSMTPRESLYLGIPTIVSDIPVHRELIESGGCTAIRTAGTEPAYYPFLEATCGHWSAVTSDGIKAALVDVYEGYERKLEAAREGAHWIAPRWRWDEILDRLERWLQSGEPDPEASRDA